MRHFARCVRGKEECQAPGEDGRGVEVLLAGYQSAGTGQKVHLPFRPSGVKKPIDLWLNVPLKISIPPGQPAAQTRSGD